jgi:hypothetical protein
VVEQHLNRRKRGILSRENRSKFSPSLTGGEPGMNIRTCFEMSAGAVWTEQFVGSKFPFCRAAGRTVQDETRDAHPPSFEIDLAVFGPNGQAGRQFGIGAKCQSARIEITSPGITGDKEIIGRRMSISVSERLGRASGKVRIESPAQRHFSPGREGVSQ